MLAAADLTLAILCGGRARRMNGLPKGLMTCEGRTLVDRLLDLRPFASEVVLVADDDSPYRHLGLRQVRDVESGKGAPGALVSALLGARTRWVLAVTCDMPYVTAELVAPLLIGDGEARVWSAGQPFPGCYAAALGSSWRAQLGGDPSVRSLVAGCRFTCPRGPGPEGRALRSVNTPADARELSVQWP